MRFAFCFSRSCMRYSLSLLRPRPCSPGGYGRISIGHFGLSHLLPLRNSFIFSRRQRRQSAPVYRAMSSGPSSDPAPLGRPAAVVRLGGDVLNGADLQAGRLQRADRGLPARPWALDEDVDLAHAVLLRLAGGVLGRHLRGERGGLARPLEADVAGGGPRDHVPGRVRDRHDRVVERALDVGVAVRDVLLLLAPDLLDGTGAGTSPGRHMFSDSYFFPAFFLPAMVFFGPLRVRALVFVRWPCTGRPRRCRSPW